MKQTAAAFGDEFSWWDDSKSLYAMMLAADAFAFGPTNRYGTISLMA
ncbi:hypothetical protein [Photorhabdus sp. RM96S]